MHMNISICSFWNIRSTISSSSNSSSLYPSPELTVASESLEYCISWRFSAMYSAPFTRDEVAIDNYSFDLSSKLLSELPESLVLCVCSTNSIQASFLRFRIEIPETFKFLRGCLPLVSTYGTTNAGDHKKNFICFSYFTFEFILRV